MGSALELWHKSSSVCKLSPPIKVNVETSVKETSVGEMALSNLPAVKLLMYSLWSCFQFYFPVLTNHTQTPAE